jgi:L-2,4-diaminobutyrate decarboxylase
VTDPHAPQLFRDTGHELVELLAAHLEKAHACDAGPVMPRDSASSLAARFPAEFPVQDDGALVAHIARAVAASTQLHSPRFVGHQVATPLPAAALCDLAASFLNNGMAVFEMGPAATAMERAVLQWMTQLAGLPMATSSGVLTSGGSLGNLTALLAARQAQSKKLGFDAWRRGLKNGPQLVVFVAETAHYSVARAARIMGLGDDGVVAIDVDEHLRMVPAALERALAEARKRKRAPIAVVASAGSTAGGAVDPLEPIADVCAREGLWLHVDGAHGASLLLSSIHARKLRGIARADSIVWDAHKMMMMPALVTAVLFRDAAAGAAAFAQDAGYLFDDADAGDDVGRRTVECTKRMMSLKLYACLRAFGTKLFADHVDHCCALAQSLAAKALARGCEVLVEPEANIVCFRPMVEGAALDGGRVAALRRRVLEDGRFYLVQLHWRGALWLRCTLSHPLTSETDLAALLDLVTER